MVMSRTGLSVVHIRRRPARPPFLFSFLSASLSPSCLRKPSSFKFSRAMVAPTVSSAQAAMVGKSIDNGSLRLLDIVGCGGFGAVYRAYEPKSYVNDSKIYAVKVVAKKKEGSGRLTQLRELAFHMEVSFHPHIVSFHRAFSDSENRYIVLEAISGGDLFSAITEKAIYLCEEELTKMVFLQLIDALAFCHAKGIFHRDIKPENVLVSADGRHWYLSDFGLATDSVRSASFKMGSKGYMSPGASPYRQLRREFEHFHRGC